MMQIRMTFDFSINPPTGLPEIDPEVDPVRHYLDMTAWNLADTIREAFSAEQASPVHWAVDIDLPDNEHF
jgi:hypothetical protein